jgi:methanogenic corrinoid protein MtbC1
VRMNDSDDRAMEPVEMYRPGKDGSKTFVSQRVQVLRREQLDRRDRARLTRLINGPVATMTAEQLAGLLDAHLEDDLRYSGLISKFYEQVSDPRTPLQDLLGFLALKIPTRLPSEIQTPGSLRTAEKVVFIEAVARHLGKRWTEDDASFIDISIACARLQDVAQALTMEASRRRLSGDAPFAAIVLPRGEQHSLMSYLTGALFQATGWHQMVLSQDSLRRDEFAQHLSRADVVCVGWSNMRLESSVRQLASEIRLHSRGKNIPIIAGGVAALDFVDFLMELGIDCLCDSAYSAISISHNYHNRDKSIRFGALRQYGSENVFPRFDRPRQ